MQDPELVSEIARGRQAALAELYDRHGGVMLSLLVRVVRDRQEAEDLLHEVFLEVWEHASDFDPTRGSVRSWLMMRARSRALDRLRALSRARAMRGDAEASVPLPMTPPLNDTLSMRRLIAALPDDLRQLIELGYYEGLSSSEIAAHERLAIGTVKSRVARALAELRHALR
jgi:RNA polymerase sigma-70 factor (ECF subfamily)